MTFDVRRLDIYRKVPKDLTQPTLTGAIISIGCIAFMAFLVFSEFIRFLSVDIQSELYVDNPIDAAKVFQKIPVFLNITVPLLGCQYIGLDIQDEMGRHEVGFLENTQKVPIDGGQGCRFEGNFQINKVPGNFHLSTHSAPMQPMNPDMRHIVHDLRFGTDMQHRSSHGSFNALDEKPMMDGQPINSHDYILKIVPSIYTHLGGESVYSYQYTYAHKEYAAYTHTGQVLPAIWFRYDLTPITVQYTERRLPIYTFLTTICAIVGGTFTVAGIIDSFVFTASEFYKKLELGKVS